MTAGKILLDVRELPTVSVDAGRGTVTIPLPASASIDSYASVEEFVAVPWRSAFDGRDITLRTTSRLRSNTTWRAQLCVQGMQIVAANPQPETTDGGGRMTWAISGSEPTDASVVVRLRPDLSTAARLWVFTGIGRYAAMAWIYLGSALLLVIGLILIPRHANGAPDLSRARLAVTTLTVIHLAVAGSLALLVAARQTEVSESNEIDLGSVLVIVAAAAGLTMLNAYWLPRGTRWWLLKLLVPGLALIAAVFWTFGYAKVSDRFTAIPDLGALGAWAALGRVLLVVGYTGLLATAVNTWQERWESRHDTWLGVAVAANLVAGIAICTPAWPELVSLIPFWVTATFTTGVILLLAALVPAELRQRLPGNQRRAAFIMVAALLTLIVVIQWAWSTYQMESIWWRAPIEQDPARYLPEVSGLLIRSSLTYPLAFLGPATALFPLVGLAGMMAVLSAVGKSEHAPLWSKGRSWVGRVLAFLVVVFVVGYGGEVLGVRLPLALLLAVGLLRLARTDRIEQAAAAVVKANGEREGEGQRLLMSRRRELLDRAQALVGLEERRAAAFNT